TFEDAQARLDALYSKIEENRAEIAPLLEENVPEPTNQIQPEQQYVPEEEGYDDGEPLDDDDF
ncbi:MAG: hypothetical protein IKX08_06070, partial [Lachnospiraceae bacterium]|nr:hypothetical protein [Lachnospiraceae bacterium]